jgi:hypothetical protein
MTQRLLSSDSRVHQAGLSKLSGRTSVSTQSSRHFPLFTHRPLNPAVWNDLRKYRLWFRRSTLIRNEVSSKHCGLIIKPSLPHITDRTRNQSARPAVQTLHLHTILGLLSIMIIMVYVLRVVLWARHHKLLSRGAVDPNNLRAVHMHYIRVLHEPQHSRSFKRRVMRE